MTHGLTVAKINWDYKTRNDPGRRLKKPLRGIIRWVSQVQIDLARLLEARGSDPIIQQYLTKPDLIWRGTSTSIGEEVQLALAERMKLGIGSLRPYDVEWRVCRRLSKLARNSRKKLKAREARRAAGVRPLSESLSRTKPWLAEGIGRSTWFARRRNAAKTALDDCVPPPSETRDAAHCSPSSENEGQPMAPDDRPLSHFSTANEAESPIQIPTENQTDIQTRGETMVEQLRPDDLKDAISEKEKKAAFRKIRKALTWSPLRGNLVPITERARGYWGTILPALGIDPKFLTAKNGPCPMCGGKDRFRFTDMDGKGTWWCNGCDDNNGRNGLGLALKFTGLPYEELTKQISAIIGGSPPPKIRPARSLEQNRDALRALWKHARPIEPDDPVDRYLTGRGITIRDYPRCLRFIRQTKHADGTVHSAMLAAVSDTDGKPATIHKTYLTFEGQKADVDRVRLFCPGPRPEGGAVRLAPHGAELGIAEGIETALAASQLFGVPVWAGLDAGGLERFIPPPEVIRLIIYGDHDANFAGHKAAYCLAMRAILVLKIKVEVKIPDRAGTDWNDVLRGVQP